MARWGSQLGLPPGGATVVVARGGGGDLASCPEVEPRLPWQRWRPATQLQGAFEDDSDTETHREENDEQEIIPKEKLSLTGIDIKILKKRSIMKVVNHIGGQI